MSFYAHGGWPNLDNLIPDLCDRMMLELTPSSPSRNSRKLKLWGGQWGLMGQNFCSFMDNFKNLKKIKALSPWRNVL